MGDPKILKKKIFITFSVMILLIVFSGALGWIFTQQIEKSNKIINTVHSLKEAELQLRREEKNLLISGFSEDRYLSWQTATENFHQCFGELKGMNALDSMEVDKISTDYSVMSDTYQKFFTQIRSGILSRDETAGFDAQFKQIGRETMEIINRIMVREQTLSAKTDWQASILIAVFLIVFVVTAGFLIIGVIRHL